MKTFVLVLLSTCLLGSAASTPAVAGEQEESAKKKPSKAQKKRAKTDKIAAETLASLMEKSARAKSLSERAFGHAVFDNHKVSLAISSGSGRGVAVENESGERTYMRMATAGLNLGLGVQIYQVVFFFEDAKDFQRFVNEGWDAGTSASAVAGTEGVGKDAAFVNGLAIFQITEKGLMLQADLTGTKYWAPKKLNAKDD
jgi:lipid-binding SYLF domain-containing protein